MTERSDGMRQKINNLRASFAAQLPARVAEARRCLAALRTAAPDQRAVATLHLILHSIKGSSNSLGYAELGVHAARGEALAERLAEKFRATDDNCGELDQCLDLLEKTIGTLPAPEQVAETPSLPAPAFEAPPTVNATRSEKLIYICDDEPLHLSLLSSQLLCFGYQTLSFDSLAELRAAVQREHPAVLIMDIVQPDGPDAGTEAIGQLRAEGAIFPVVFVSSRVDFEARLNAIRAGGEAYFARPVNAMDLVTVLDRLIAQPRAEPFRVLVVDDEPEMSELHSMILQQAGMITQSVNHADTVLEQVAAFRPDLVLMDMYMPKCSGREVSKLIRQIPDFVSMPIVFLSRETDKVKQFSAMSIGADGFLTKPIDPSELVMSVSLRAERMRTLRSMMVRDSLTGLFNHTTTTHLLENAVSAARRQPSEIAFAMLDLDKFKSVNDTYGHPVGDQVLLALARVLKQRLRKSDLVGRYGGEEFAVIMHDLNAEQAHSLMDELRQYFSQVVITAGAVQFSCTFSCGIANFPLLGDVDALREAADTAMYEAKHAGRNRVVSFAFDQP